MLTQFSPDQAVASKALLSLTAESVPSGSDNRWFMKNLLNTSKVSVEDEKMRSYFKHLKQETAKRLLEKLYNP